jgi:hypothetical protein
MLKIDGVEYPLKVRYIGETDKLAMINGKIYSARECGKGWLAVIDETAEEYSYPCDSFESVTETVIQKIVTEITERTGLNRKELIEFLQRPA